MTNDDVKQNIWRNSVSNYACVGLRLLTGLFMFRLLYQKLPKEDFGFWAILWSLFGYGILFDFGFGFTAQKRVAELSVHRDWQKLSRVLSTIFFCYLAVAGIFFLLGAFASGTITQFFEISPENRKHYREVMTYFLCGLGVAFPLGLFPEILRGQQRISLANYIFAAAMLVHVGLIALAVYQGWGLKVMLVMALACTFIPDLLCGYFALRRMPEVRIHPKFFSRAMISETMSFSLYAYLMTLSTIMVTKTDQFVIGAALAVAVVPIYQAGAKIAEMFAGISLQLPDTFSPAAAHLHAKGDRAMLQRLLVDGTRFSVMVATPLYLIFAFYMSPLLRLLTGDVTAHPETYWTAQVLLLWCYMLVLTQSVSKRIFVMCGHERRLMWLGLGESALNLALSIGLILYFKTVICVAIGSLVATSLFGWLCLWPWSAREANLSGWALTRTVVVPTWLACLPLLALILATRLFPAMHVQQNLFSAIVGGVLAFIVSAAGLWRISLTSDERIKLTAIWDRHFHRQRAV